MSRYFLKTFSMYTKPISEQTKMHFKNLKFLTVTYDMGFLSFDVDLTTVLFSFVLTNSRNF